MLVFKLLISYRFLWLLLGAISVFLFFIAWYLWFFAIFFNDSLRYAHTWFSPELVSQIGLDKYINNYTINLKFSLFVPIFILSYLCKVEKVLLFWAKISKLILMEIHVLRFLNPENLFLAVGLFASPWIF